MSTNFGKCVKTVTMMMMLIASPMILFAEEGTLEWIQTVEFENQYVLQTSSCLDHQENLIHTYNYMSQNEESIQTWDIQKIGSDGVLLWEMTLLSETNYESSIKVAADNDGNIYAAGNISNDEMNTSIRVLKLDPYGTIIWDIVLPLEWMELQNLIYRPDGYLAVVHHNYEEWGISTLFASDDQMGEVAWTSSVFDINDNGLMSLDFSGIDSNNRITLLGSIYCSQNVGIGWARFEANGSNDVEGLISGDSANESIGDTQMDSEGNVYTLFGQDSHTIFKLIRIGSDGALTWSVLVSGAIPDMYETSIVLTQEGPVVAYSTDEGSVVASKHSIENGTNIWDSEIRTSIGFLPRSSIVIGDEDKIYLLGSSYGMVETYTLVCLLPDGEIENWILNFSNPSVTGNVVGIPQYIESGSDAIYGVSLFSNWETESMGIDEFRINIGTSSNVDNESDLLPNTFTVNTYPNPFNATVNIKLNMPVRGDVNIRLVNLLGQTVYELQENIGNGSHTLSLNAEGFTSGMYLLSVADQKGNHITKRITLLK